jgi:hypothetical protein
MHFEALKRARELKEMFEINLLKTPLLDFLVGDRFTGGFQWSENDLSVIANSGRTSLD